MSVKELELAVSKLPSEELTSFAQWFEEFMADQWDKQIEADILVGRLSAAGKHADEAFEVSRATPQNFLPPQNVRIFSLLWKKYSK